jgi:hypothetical protein
MLSSKADHLAVLAETAAFVSGVTSLPDVPLVMISGGDQPPDTIAKHRELGRLSSQSQHLVMVERSSIDCLPASNRDHWALRHRHNACRDASEKPLG